MKTREAAGSEGQLELPLDRLRRGRYQPRRDIGQEALAALADSIRAQGVIQPVVVRPAPDGNGEYEIVAGERRWRAAQLAGLLNVPAIVRETSDRDALSIALIENIQREDLNPMDQALALQRLADEFSLTHQAIADTVGRSRSTVTNLLRLLELHPEVQRMLADGEIEMGHARALLSLQPDRQVRAAKRALSGRLSVRDVEQLVKRMLMRDEANAGSRGPGPDLETRWFQEALSKELGRQVTVRTDKTGHRSLAIDFDSLEQLQGALQQLEDLIGRLRETAGPRAKEAATSEG
ncbi:MAG: ParB/RepB/Spo0J family partition protein [Gammaproteobacteria bacterium]